MNNFLLILLAILSIRCSDDQKIVKRVDYMKYMVSQDQRTLNSKRDFWHDRLASNDRDQTSREKLAALYAERFKESLDPRDILYSDSLYRSILALKSSNDAELYQSLATNAMSRHNFQAAKYYVEKAIDIGDNMTLSRWISVDLAVETGQPNLASRWLEEVKNIHSFQYLIRMSKIMDLRGDQSQAIELMEQSLERIRGNSTMASWVFSILGDMYVHAGRVDDAYLSYLQALERDRTQWHALKGIAWIALCHDKEIETAREIVQFLMNNYCFPGGNLLLAEIETVFGDETKGVFYADEFMRETDDSLRAKLFARDRILLLTDVYHRTSEAILLAQQEVKNRPSAISYDLLAWAYYQDGQFETALGIAQRHVAGGSHEPLVLYHLGMIYQAGNLEDQSIRWLSEAMGGALELGPTLARKIEHELQKNRRS